MAAKSPMFNVECPLFARRRSEHAVYSDISSLQRAVFLLLVHTVRQGGGGSTDIDLQE
jgi:hypothetical protein